MISFQDARRAVLDSVNVCAGKERRAPESALGLFLSESVRSKVDLPPFDNSAMDGYAISTSDLMGNPSLQLPVEGIAPAGGGPMRLVPGTAMRIFTGAPVPMGADAVVMQEEAVVSSDRGRVSFQKPPRAGQNIRRAGEESRRGSLIAPAGIQITPAVAAALHASGTGQCEVFSPPDCAVVVTGDEIVAAGAGDLGHGHIFDSNSPALVASLKGMRIPNITVDRSPDDPAMLAAALGGALTRSDVVIVSGGVSVGDRDFVRGVLASLGVREIVWGVAVKPGKPFYFGIGPDEQYVFGLPGNPVSVLITFHELVRPAIRKFMGAAEPVAASGWAKLTQSLAKKAGRLEFVRGTLTHRGIELWVEPITSRESHMLGSLVAADALIVFPEDAAVLEAGQSVEYRPVRWLY